eukprot:CAMPEP_0183290810 /NCGR_PEP_ID=MMETSP0160_2-20130417/401_1 /TAXON_ID=2839 ORGANISM="Odontella Sinensis, Strain Grunow 1884" /NCGR_SAMPLE_ID=MMETSP0160_2 /ASSEMBLY_ACC=CAM_ASM_000250 /LENGTH=252 /DNA_ID=CAMNT_0025451479 /DNA_START=71 /DNA_END=829 /DNA_ORIENTATION=+
MRTSVSALVFLTAAASSARAFSPLVHRPTDAAPRPSAVGPLSYGGRGDYYGESGSSFMVREFGAYEDLEEIVKLTARPLPERPDGIVCVCKFTSAERPDCVRNEAEYERMARDSPATCFLRCFEEYEGADGLFAQAQVTSLPTFDLFYGGRRVARLEGNDHPGLEELLDRYQFQNTELDLFSEDADNKRRLAWGDGKLPDYNKTPRTTNRFIPGYDWDKDKGFFDDLGDKFQDEWDKIYGDYGEWVPEVEDK